MFRHSWNGFVRRVAPVAGVLLTVTVGVAQVCEEIVWTALGAQPGGVHLMAYDSARGVLVTFDGSTWETPGDRPWVKRADAGPSGRGGSAMVYDAARGNCVLFGGDRRSDTWTWNGEHWTLVSNTGPAGRRLHSMTYDTDNQRVLLFGGRDADFAPLGDTWAWDGSAWELLTTSGPTPRSGASMSYDTARHRAVLYGGVSFSVQTIETDTWEFDGERWTRLSFVGPTRTDQSMCYDVGRGVTVLHGGTAFGYLGDTWEWNGVAWTQVDSTGPAGVRSAAAMAYHAGIGRVMMAGGSNSSAPPQIGWSWDGTAWSAAWSDPVTPPIGRGGMVYDPVRERGVAHIDTGAERQTWEWDGHAWELAVAGNTLPYGPMVFDTARSATLLFSEAGELWTWDGVQWVRSNASGPGARTEAALAFDSDRGVAVLFGGALHRETWEWDGTEWRMFAAATDGPLARRSPVMSYDPVAHRTVMYGGYYQNAIDHFDTWAWDGTRWTLATPVGPTGRNQARMTYDSARARMVLMGGIDYLPRGEYSCFADSWEYSASSGWEQVETRIPPGWHASFLMSYDAARDNIVFHGGTEQCLPDRLTWLRAVRELDGIPTIVEPPQDAVISLGEGVSFRVDAASDGLLTYQWRRNGTPIPHDFTLRVSGERSSILSIVNAVTQDVGMYDVVVTNACGSVVSEPARLDISDRCWADFNTDGVENSQDYFDFLTEFFEGSPAADVDGSGDVTSADFFAFLTEFFRGCAD